MTTSETSRTQLPMIMLALFSLVAAGAMLLFAVRGPAYDYTWIEAPLLLLTSGVSLGLLARLAAFPPRSGVLLRRRFSITLGCGSCVALALILWCPWGPVHAIRGVLTFGIIFLQAVVLTAIGKRDSPDAQQTRP